MFVATLRLQTLWFCCIMNHSLTHFSEGSCDTEANIQIQIAIFQPVCYIISNSSQFQETKASAPAFMEPQITTNCGPTCIECKNKMHAFCNVKCMHFGQAHFACFGFIILGKQLTVKQCQQMH